MSLLVGSAEAMDMMATTAPLLRQRILEVMACRAEGLTPDEAADELGVDRLAVRPRFTELKKQNLIRKNGQHRKNKSGIRAAAYEAA